nr:hypothetical protein [Streptomyces sp. NRRL S-340]
MLLPSVVPVLAAGAVVLGTAPAEAAAGGEARRVPDVALVVAGGSGRTTTLRSGESGFLRLRQLLEPERTGTEPVPDAWAEGRYPPARLTVVWGLTGVGGWPQTDRAPGGDVAVERQDQLIVAADGTPWVRSDPAPDVEDDDIRWHRAPRALYGRFDWQGLLGSGAEAAVSGGGRHRAGGLSAGGRGWWAVGGSVAGVGTGAVGVLLAGRIRRAAARRGAGPPRQELIDR